MYVEVHDIARVLARENLTLEDVKKIMRGVRYERGVDERLEYANTLLPEAAEYLPSHAMAALVRADISKEEASKILEQNKGFFFRLTDLLPSLVRFLDEGARNENPRGIVMMIDDCHSDFHATLASLRKDRQLREAREKLTSAAEITKQAASALKGAARHFDIEFDRFRLVYLGTTDGPSRFLGDLIRELEMCSGVLEIVNATAEIQPKRLFLSGNDTRTTVVGYAYHLSRMWNGPSLVTTPGSDFAMLCSLLFEAVSGRADEGLAGAINRYARSESRKQWDLEGEDEEERENDNFLGEKQRMLVSAQEIELYRSLLPNHRLSRMAKLLLHLRITSEQQTYDAAESTYGPRQVYPSHMNAEQLEKMLIDAASRMKPEQLKSMDERALSNKSLAELDIELGRARRSFGREIDV